MARSRITQPSVDLVSDSGTVLLSIIQGEQLEYPVTLHTAPAGHTLKATLVEAQNIAFQTERPTALMPAEVSTQLNVRVPTYRNNWSAPTPYAVGDMVAYGGLFYLRDVGGALTDGTPPDVSPLWVATPRTRVYLQIPSTAINTWSVKPGVEYAVYGFLELAITENTGVFPRTWKPVRGMTEFLFSL